MSSTKWALAFFVAPDFDALFMERVGAVQNESAITDHLEANGTFIFVCVGEVMGKVDDVGRGGGSKDVVSRVHVTDEGRTGELNRKRK